MNEALASGRGPLSGRLVIDLSRALAGPHAAMAVRTRIAQLDGVWRDTVLLERGSEIN